MNVSLIILFIMLFIPIVYLSQTGYLNRFVIDNKKRKQLDMIVQQVLNEKDMKDVKIMDYRDVRTYNEEGKEKIVIEVFLMKSGTKTSWNDMEKLFLIEGEVSKGVFTTIIFEETNVHDYRMLEQENTSNFLDLSTGIPNLIKNQITRFSTEPLPKPTDGHDICTGLATSSIMCEQRDMYRTNEKMMPIEHELKKDYGLQDNGEILPTTDITRAYQCEVMTGLIKDQEINNHEMMFACKTRPDHGFNEHIVTEKNYMGNDDFF